MLCIFIKNEHHKYVSNIEIASCATGIANIIGNKGFYFQ